MDIEVSGLVMEFQSELSRKQVKKGGFVVDDANAIGRFNPSYPGSRSRRDYLREMTAQTVTFQSELSRKQVKKWCRPN